MSGVSIFISHRTADRDIADAVRKNLELWGVPESRIFQSTNPESGVRIGDEIKESLISTLRTTDLLILIYTSPDKDWSYCMWELGIATANDTKPTRIICMSCAEEPPKLMVDTHNCRVKLDDVQRLVNNFHKSKDFVASDPDTVKEDATLLGSLASAGEHVLETRAKQFFEDLKELMPSGQSRVLHRWDYLKLVLPAGAVRDIKQLGDDAERIPQQFDIIRSQTEVHKDSQNSALRAFGYQDFQIEITLDALRARWESEIVDKAKSSERSNYVANSDWANDLNADVLRAIFNKRAQRTFNYFESIAIEQQTLFRPAVIKAMSSIDDSMEFDVYLYRLEATEMELIDNLIKRRK